MAIDVNMQMQTPVSASDLANATQAANSAIQAANQASTTANGAANTAQAADTKAGQALTASQAASQTADMANTNAAAAKSIAQNAFTAAGEAATAATNAQNSANTANTAAQAAETAATNSISTTLKGQPNGVATLDSNGKIPTAQLPPIGGEVDPPDLVSGDAANALGIGQDGKLFVLTADAGGITDVKVNGTSVVSGSVANIVNMATSEDVNAAVTLSEEYTDTAIETVRGEIPNVSNLADKNEIPDVSEFVKESNINEAIDAHNENVSAHDDIRYALEVVDLKIPAMIHEHDTSNTAHTDMREDISVLNNAYDDIETDIKALEKRIDGFESLGRWAGTFPTFDDVPTTTSAFKHISENDFIYVDKDENHDDLYSRYFVAEINDGNVIVWSFDRSWNETDISNKMDKLPSATGDNFIMFDESGNAKDSEWKPADFVNNTNFQQISVPKQFDDTVTFNDVRIDRVEGVTPNAIISVSNAFQNDNGVEEFIRVNNGRITNLGDPINSQDAANKRYVDSKTGGAGSVLEEVEFAADFHYTDVKWRRIMTFTVPPDDTEESYNNLHGKLLITLKNSAAWPGGSSAHTRNGIFEFRHGSSVYFGQQRWQGIPALSGFNLPVPCRVVVTDNAMHVDIMSQVSGGQYGSGTFKVQLIAADFGGYTWTQDNPEYVTPNAEIAYELKTLGLTENNSGIQSNKFFDSSGNDVARQFPMPDYSAFRVDSMHSESSTIQPGASVSYVFSEDCYFWFGADQDVGGSLNLHMNGGWIFDHLNNNTHYLKIQTGIFFAVQGDTLVLNNQTAMLYNPQIRKFGVKFISR